MAETKHADAILDEGKGAPSQSASTTVASTTAETTVVPAETTIVPAETTIALAAAETTVVPASTTEIPESINEELLVASLRAQGIMLSGETLQEFKVRTTNPVELENQRKAKRGKLISFGRDNALFSEEEYQASIIDYAKDKDVLALEVFTRDFKNDIAGTDKEGTYTDDDIAGIFERKDFTDKQKQRMADNYLKQTYGHLSDDVLENKFTEHETEINTATQYKGTVQAGLNLIPKKLMFNIKGIEVGYDIKDEVLAKIKSVYLDQETGYRAFKGKLNNPDDVANAIISNIKGVDFDRIMEDVAVSYHSQKIAKMKMGRQGMLEDIIPPDEQEGDTKRYAHADAILDEKLNEKKKA